jgi:hypothetical protein
MYIQILPEDLHLWYHNHKYYGSIFIFTNTMILLTLAYNNGYLNHNCDFYVGECELP